MQNNFSEDEIFELIDRASNGDKRAFELIVRIYQRYAFAVAFKILCDEHDAKEVVQETFIRIWKHISKYDKKIKFTTWMYKIIVNLCYDKLKSRKRRNKVFEMIDDNSMLHNLIANDLEKDFTNKDFAQIINHFVDGLPVKQRMVFILRMIEELTVEETAKTLDMSIGSVKTNLSFARQNLRNKLIGFEK